MALFKTKSSQGIACPYCFVPVDIRSVGFRCSGQPAAGNLECVEYPDPQREDILNDNKPVLPPVLRRTPSGQHVVDDRERPLLETSALNSAVTCDRCQGRTSTAICVHCHSPLPAELTDGGITIGVVGARNSGKTVLLTMLDQQLMFKMAERFQVSIDHPGGTVGLADKLSSFRGNMESRLELPPQTQASGGLHRQPPSVYRWKWLDGSGRSAKSRSRIISIYDTAGEDVANLSAAMGQHHLKSANAIMFVVDPFSFPENRYRAREKGIDPGNEQLTSDVLDGLSTVLSQSATAARGSNGKVDIPVAVVISKIDAFWDDFDAQSPLRRIAPPTPYFDEEESITAHHHLEAMMREWGATSILNKLQAEFSQYRLFGVSALGEEPDYSAGSLKSNVRPSRIADPLLWILNRDNFVPGTPTQRHS